MIKRMFGAAVRAALVASVPLMPVVLLPGATGDSLQLAALLSFVAAMFVFVEYSSEFPSVIDFRDAPPLNRMRFATLFLTVFLLTATARGQVVDFRLGDDLGTIAGLIGQAMDFPFSPVRLVVLQAPETASLAQVDMIRSFSGTAYLISLAALIIFVAFVRLFDWPLAHGAFNFWVNLPLIDPTAGGDILQKVRRASHVNVALGFLLPFLIPAVLRTASDLTDAVSLTEPQTLIWTVSVWAFLPISLIMRGVALMRIANLIEEKRRRAYAQAELLVA